MWSLCPWPYCRPQLPPVARIKKAPARRLSTTVKTRFRHPVPSASDGVFSPWLARLSSACTRVERGKRRGKRRQGALFPQSGDTAVMWLDEHGDEDPGRIRPLSGVRSSCSLPRYRQHAVMLTALPTSTIPWTCALSQERRSRQRAAFFAARDCACTCALKCTRNSRVGITRIDVGDGAKNCTSNRVACTRTCTVTCRPSRTESSRWARRRQCLGAARRQRSCRDAASGIDRSCAQRVRSHLRDGRA